jgi:hypothetical protein
VITDRAAYERLCERERWDRLRTMSMDESVAVLEALLGSGLVEIAVFADDDRPMTLARSLRVPAERLPG